MRRILCSLLPLGLGLVCFAGCYGATEIRVTIQTDVPCATVRQNGISVRATGAAATLPDATVIASSATCTDGAAGQLNDVGSIVFVPTSGTPQVSIRVVLGVDVPTDACDPVSSNGCITADRRLTYEKHSTLQLPIRLDDACIGRVCGDGKTCSAGLCVTSSATCAGTSCGSVESEDASTPPIETLPLPTDGGLVDATFPVQKDAGLPADGGALCAAAAPSPRCAGCTQLKPVCCFEENAVNCYATETQCADHGVPASKYNCTTDCQCAGLGKTCDLATHCAPGIARVCDGRCYALQ